MEEDNQQTNIPALCKKGCGFYGNQAFSGLCSKCHNSINVTQKDQHPVARKSSAELKPKPTCDKADSWSPSTGCKSAEATPSPSTDTEMKAAQPDASSLPSGTSECQSKSSEPSAAPVPPAKKINRCGVCKTKLGLTGFECNCGGLYCALHRYSDEHECGFDYRQKGQSEIRLANPVISSSKVNKI